MNARFLSARSMILVILEIPFISEPLLYFILLGKNNNVCSERNGAILNPSWHAQIIINCSFQSSFACTYMTAVTNTTGTHYFVICLQIFFLTTDCYLLPTLYLK